MYTFFTVRSGAISSHFRRLAPALEFVYKEPPCMPNSACAKKMPALQRIPFLGGVRSVFG